MDALLITAGLVLLLILAGATDEGAGSLFGLLFVGALLYLIVRVLV